MVLVGATQPCPMCGADAKFRIGVEIAGTTATYVALRNNREEGLPAIPQVCSRCGNVQFFVDQLAFRNDQEIDINTLSSE